MFTSQFWRSTIERAVKTLAQSLLVILPSTGTGLIPISWPMALSTAATTALVSVLTSIASTTVGEPNSPSLLPLGSTAPTPAATASVTAS